MIAHGPRLITRLTMLRRFDSCCSVNLAFDTTNCSAVWNRACPNRLVPSLTEPLPCSQFPEKMRGVTSTIHWLFCAISYNNTADCVQYSSGNSDGNSSSSSTCIFGPWTLPTVPLFGAWRLLSAMPKKSNLGMDESLPHGLPFHAKSVVVHAAIPPPPQPPRNQDDGPSYRHSALGASAIWLDL